VAPVGLWRLWGWHPVLGREPADAALAPRRVEGPNFVPASLNATRSSSMRGSAGRTARSRWSGGTFGV
jgi:hypothetical protein